MLDVVLYVLLFALAASKNSKRRTRRVVDSADLVNTNAFVTL